MKQTIKLWSIFGLIGFALACGKDEEESTSTVKNADIAGTYEGVIDVNASDTSYSENIELTAYLSGNESNYYIFKDSERDIAEVKVTGNSFSFVATEDSSIKSFSGSVSGPNNVNIAINVELNDGGSATFNGVKTSGGGGGNGPGTGPTEEYGKITFGGNTYATNSSFGLTAGKVTQGCIDVHWSGAPDWQYLDLEKAFDLQTPDESGSYTSTSTCDGLYSVWLPEYANRTKNWEVDDPIERYTVKSGSWTTTVYSNGIKVTWNVVYINDNNDELPVTGEMYALFENI